MRNKSIVLTLMLLCSATQVWSYDFKIGQLYYTIISNADLTVKVTSEYSLWHNGGRFYFQGYSNGSGYTGERTFRSGYYIYFDSLSEYYADSRGNRYSDYSRRTNILCTDPHGVIDIPATVTYQNITFTVTSIDDHAFYGCKYLTQVSIPSSITSIGDSAFYGCSRLETISAPNVATIGNTAFSECTSLMEMSFANNLISIGDCAFSGCTHLTLIQLENILVPPAVSSNTLNGVPLYASVYVPCSCISAYQQDPIWNRFSHFYGLGAAGMLVVNSQNDTLGIAQIIDSATCYNPATIQATAYHGYHFAVWNDGDTNNPRVVMVDGDTSFTAFFEKNFFQITTSYIGNGGYVIGDTTAEYLSIITISAVPNERYRFLQWQDGDTNNPRTIVVTDNANYTPTFIGKQYRVAVQAIGGNNTCVATISNSYYYGGTDTAIMITYDGGSEYYMNANISSTPSGYQFKRWTDGHTENPRQIVSMSGDVAYGNTNILSDTVFFAEFERRPIAITTNVGSGTTIGTTGWTSGDTTVLYGDSVTLIATPNSHWHFQYWHSSQTGQTYYDNPLTIEATMNAKFNAYFDLDKHIVTCLTDGGGTALNDNDVSGQRHYQAEWYYNRQVQIYATPNDGNRFVMWNDSNVFATRTITVLSDTTFTAYFAPIESLRDTIYIFDTIYIHDTVYVGVDDVTVTNVKMYVQGSEIVVENAEGYTVSLYDAVGRLIERKVESGERKVFAVPVSGTYLVKIGNLPARKIVVVR